MRLGEPGVDSQLFIDWPVDKEHMRSVTVSDKNALIEWRWVEPSEAKSVPKTCKALGPAAGAGTCPEAPQFVLGFLQFFLGLLYS